MLMCLALPLFSYASDLVLADFICSILYTYWTSCPVLFAYLPHPHVSYVSFSLVLWPMMNTKLTTIKWPRSVCFSPCCFCLFGVYSFLPPSLFSCHF
jgi:hypothetical protein